MDDVLWKLDGVGMGGGPSVPRLHDVTLCLRAGVTAVMGPSGAGKTSLLNLLVGFESADRGAVQCRIRPQDGRMPVFWVPQEGGLWPQLTAREHLLAVAGDGARPDEADELLHAFDLQDRAAAYPDDLSMGERSRLAVARGLMAGPAVLVMDEPFVHVDRARTGRYWEALRRWVARSGASLVFATHSPGTVLAEAERVVCVAAGRILFAGDVEQLYRRPATREQAECLGEVNWFAPGEARVWLDGAADERACYRPEEVLIARAPEGGPLVVDGSRFRGAVSEVALRHEATGAVRTFFCASLGARLRAGERVIVRVLTLLVTLLLVGCGGRDDPAIPVQGTSIWRIPPDGSMIPAPRSVAIGRAGEAFVLDTVGRILVFDEAGKVLRTWRMPEVEKGRPEGLCVLTDGRIVVCDTHYSRIVTFDGEGRVLGMFGQYGTGPGEFIYPIGIARDDRDVLYICEYGGNDRVQKFTADGTLLGAFGSFGTGERQFQRPSGIAWDRGRLYVADAINNRILMFSDDGGFLGLLGPADDPLSFRFPYGVSVAADGALYVVEYGAGRVSKVGLDGRLLGRYGTAGTGDGQFRTPWGVAVDPQMRLRVADTGNHRIVELKL